MPPKVFFVRDSTTGLVSSK